MDKYVTIIYDCDDPGREGAMPMLTILRKNLTVKLKSWI